MYSLSPKKVRAAHDAPPSSGQAVLFGPLDKRSRRFSKNKIEFYHIHGPLSNVFCVNSLHFPAILYGNPSLFKSVCIFVLKILHKPASM